MLYWQVHPWTFIMLWTEKAPVWEIQKPINQKKQLSRRKYDTQGNSSLLHSIAFRHWQLQEKGSDGRKMDAA